MVDSAREQISLRVLEAERAKSAEEACVGSAAANSSLTVQHCISSTFGEISPTTSTVPKYYSNENSIETNVNPSLPVTFCTDNTQMVADNAALTEERKGEGATASSSVSGSMPISKAEKDKKNQQKKSGVDIIGNHLFALCIHRQFIFSSVKGEVS